MAKYNNNATVAVGSTESNTIYLNETIPTGFVVSGSVVTGSLVSFLVSNDNINFYPLHDSTNTEISLTVSTTPKAYSLNPETFMGWSYIKIRLGTSASSKVQATYPAQIELATDSM